MKSIKGKNDNKKNKKEKFSKRHPRISLAIRLTILAIVIMFVIAAGIIVGMIYGAWGQVFEISEDELIISGNSVVLDSEGNVLAELSGDENRKIVTLEEMSDYIPKAYVAIEDERFYSHGGVDIKRTSGAIFTYIINRGSSSFGGSTITQQLVKNITKDDENTGIEGVTRKVKEWAKAYQIEKMLNKDQILELYLNIIFVGAGNSGVEVGSEYYFNKSAKDLTLVESAFLAGINNAPNTYNPYGDYAYGKDENKTEKINNRTKVVLTKMLELEYINEEEYNKAIEEVNAGIKFEKGTQNTAVNSYHTDATIAQVISDIAEQKNWSTEYATTYLYGGGLTIYSTQDTKVQNEMEKVMQKNASKYAQKSKITKDSNGEYVSSQSAMVVIDNETGSVIGCVGGLGEKETSRGLNRATQSVRQTGSSMKPLADVLPALEEGLVTASTLYDDCATEFAGNYEPTDEGAYKGIINLRSAITTSQNIPFVKIMAELTNPVAKTYLEKMGITTLDDENDAGLALAIGGLYKGVSPLEMAAAYATIANDGVYRTPIFYTKVADSDGNIFIETKQEETQVCSVQTAYVIKDLLKSVVTASNGTAKYCKISGIDVAAKTGTTNNHYDRWLCGFTNYYTAATWYGFDVNEYVVSNWRSPAGQIFSAVMNSIHSGKEKSTFEKPDKIVTVKVCKQTGLKATNSCKSTYNEIFIKGTEPKACDEASSAVQICEDTELLATDYCPNVITKYYSYIVEKERLKLWKNLSSSVKNGPSEECTEHTKENSAKNLAPQIVLVGKQEISLNVGDIYTEEGATAKDPTDGDLTRKIKISGNVNTTKEGTYTVTYTVTNSKEITTTVERIIVVNKKTGSETINTIQKEDNDKDKDKKPTDTSTTNTVTDNNSSTPTENKVSEDTTQSKPNTTKTEDEE